MKKDRNGRDEHVEPLLVELGRRVTPPGEAELREIARRAAEAPRAAPATGARARWAHPVRWVAAAASFALLIGSALGFFIADSATSPETAQASFAGSGFIPARGWTVVQSGRVDAAGALHAVAANVPLRPEDDGRDIPYATLAFLPARGIVIVATFTTRGDAGTDFGYPVRSLPLQIATATQVPEIPTGRPLAEYSLRAGVRGTNVDARIFFGADQLSPALRAAAQRQLDRLAVASERVTIFARPTILDSGPVNVFGSVDNGRAGEEVVIQAKDCGSRVFRLFAGAETRDGGGYSTVIYPRITTTMRAVWGDDASNQITVQKRAAVGLLRQRTGRGFRVGVGGIRSFWRKRVLIQARRGAAWRTVKTVVLTDSVGTIVGGGSYTEAKFTLPVRKGTVIRAVLPLSQAKPCYLAGISRTLRV